MGDKSLSSIYRPISLASQVCEVLESIVRDSIAEHVENLNLSANRKMDSLKLDHV